MALPIEDTLENFKEFIRLKIAEGLTCLEAVSLLDKEQLRQACIREMELLGGELFLKHYTLFNYSCVAYSEQCQEEDFAKATELWLAGWTSEYAEGRPAPVMSWYWRSPAKKGRSEGRLYRSTNQAFNAMRRQTK